MRADATYVRLRKDEQMGIDTQQTLLAQTAHH